MKKAFAPISSVAAIVTIALLSIYGLVKRLADPSTALAFSDRLALANSISQQCTIIPAKNPWTPPVACLNELLGQIIQIPILYLVVTITLKLLIVLVLFRLYLDSQPEQSDQDKKILTSLVAIILLTVGGVGRLFIGGSDLILLSAIYNGVWAQLLILIAIYLLIIQRNPFFSGLVLALAVFLHPANVIHVVLIGLIAISIETYATKHYRSLLMFGIPTGCAIFLQYVAAYGLPNVDLSNFTFGGASTDLIQSITTTEIGVGKRTASDWYAYVLSQDPDDLSLIWLLNSTLGCFYIIFCIFGIFFAISVEKINSWSLFFRTPMLVLASSALFYIAICSSLEYFQVSELILELLILTQPRRVLYLPIVILVFFATTYTVNYFFDSNQVTRIRAASLVVFFLTFFGFLVLTTNSINISKSIVITCLLTALALVIIRYTTVRSDYLLRIVSKTAPVRIALLLLPLVVFIKIVPFSTSVSAANLKTIFFTQGNRTFDEYILLDDRLKNDNRYSTIMKLAEWINSETRDDSYFVSAGFAELSLYDLSRLTARSITTLNAYKYRGGTHFSKESYEKWVYYFEHVLKFPESSLEATQGEVKNLEEIVGKLDENYFLGIQTRALTGRKFDYFATKYQLDLSFPIVFRQDGVTVYRITSEH